MKFNLLIFIIIFVAVAILGFMWINLSNTIESLAKQQVKETAEKAETKMDFFFKTIRTQLIQIKELTDNGKMDAEFDTDMNYYLFPIFNTSKQITTFALARTDGDEYSLIREDSTWLNNFVYETDSGMNIYREKWKGDYQNRQIIRKWTDYNAGYDPRTRDWFKGAASAKDTTVPFWSKPYKILFQEFPGITAAMKAKSKKQGEFNIVQWDILLSDISGLTAELAFSENGRTFLICEDFKILGLPKDKRFVSEDSLQKYVLMPFDSLQNHQMTKTLKLWKRKVNTFDTPFSYKDNGEKWWGYLHKYILDNNRYFIIGVIVPESDFLSEVKRTRWIISGSSILVIIFLLIVTVAYFDKRKANRILRLQKAEIEQQKEEIETQRDEIERQHKLVIKQIAHIEKINKEITDSIKYAKRIQDAILPTGETMNKRRIDYFIVFRPKNIVSGDFYWMAHKKGKIIIAAADCTGHGVPGAFMSMLGTAFLNEIVNKEDTTHPGDILHRLREEIIHSLRQKGRLGEQKDGMDMALAVLDVEKDELLFSGANNPLYIVRKFTDDKKPVSITSDRKLKTDIAVLYEIKGDKMPIAHYVRMNPFKTHKIQLQKSDRFYLFSDGYADQFGGERGTKFKYKPFKRLLLKTANEDIQKQGLILEQTFMEWIDFKDPFTGKMYEQIDDITILGIEI